jgi:lactam utilization protein B
VGTVDFNADLGESLGLWRIGADDELMRVISSANVACGFHAGDPNTMHAAVTSAARHGVAVGAHPGLPDRLGFGRRRMDVTPVDLRNYVVYQGGALVAFLGAAGVSLHHEFFADRPIRRDGTVVMFGWQEHFDAAPDTVADRVRSLVTTGAVASLEGDPVTVTAATICVHSDTPGAGDIGVAVKAAIEAAGATISSELDLAQETMRVRLEGGGATRR